MPTEGETIKQLVVKARKEWDQLYEIYLEEDREQAEQNAEANKMDDIRKALETGDEDQAA